MSSVWGLANIITMERRGMVEKGEYGLGLTDWLDDETLEVDTTPEVSVGVTVVASPAVEVAFAVDPVCPSVMVIVAGVLAGPATLEQNPLITLA